MSLPDISAIEGSWQAYSDSFLQVGYILSQYLKQIERDVSANEDFTNDPFNTVALGLFSKLRCHFYSAFLLQLHYDEVGSQFLIEHLCETTITLIYLLEEADETIFSEYVVASGYQVYQLLSDVEAKLRTSPDDSSLLKLRDKLRACISQQNRSEAVPSIPNFKEANNFWEGQGLNTTAKRGAAMGLGLILDPARSVRLRITPASWLDLQFNYSKSSPSILHDRTEPVPDFKCLRDIAHLCLHATKAFLEEFLNSYWDVKALNIAALCMDLDQLFEWFHTAHAAYKHHLSTGNSGLV